MIYKPGSLTVITGKNGCGKTKYIVSLILAFLHQTDIDVYTNIPLCIGEIRAAGLDVERIKFFESPFYDRTRDTGVLHPIEPAPDEVRVKKCLLVVDEVGKFYPGGTLSLSAIKTIHEKRHLGLHIILILPTIEDVASAIRRSVDTWLHIVDHSQIPLFGLITYLKHDIRVYNSVRDGRPEITLPFAPVKSESVKDIEDVHKFYYTNASTVYWDTEELQYVVAQVPSTTEEMKQFKVRKRKASVVTVVACALVVIFLYMSYGAVTDTRNIFERYFLSKPDDVSPGMSYIPDDLYEKIERDFSELLSKSDDDRLPLVCERYSTFDGVSWCVWSVDCSKDCYDSLELMLKVNDSSVLNDLRVTSSLALSKAK